MKFKFDEFLIVLAVENIFSEESFPITAKVLVEWEALCDSLIKISRGMFFQAAFINVPLTPYIFCNSLKRHH